VWRFGMVIGKPTFVPVQDLEMGFEKMVKIAHSSGGRTRIFKLECFVRIYVSHFPTNCSIQARKNWRKIERWGQWLILHSYTVIVLGVPSEIKKMLMYEFCDGFWRGSSWCKEWTFTLRWLHPSQALTITMQMR